MQIEMKATPDIVCLDGVYCRVWEGVTAGGVLCKVFVHRVAVDEACDSAEFDQELRACLPPGREIDLDQVLRKRQPPPHFARSQLRAFPSLIVEVAPDVWTLRELTEQSTTPNGESP